MYACLGTKFNRMSDFQQVSDQYVLDTPVVRDFVAEVRAAIAAASSPEAACEAIRPRFAELLADTDWLPGEFADAVPDPSSSAAGHSPPDRLQLQWAQDGGAAPGSRPDG